jgi:formylglycine-generating enzyme required for sulfatase activity
MTTTNRPLRVFLCHSSNDKPAVRELYKKLSAEAWIKPWLDEQELLPGQDWDLEIENAVQKADAVIVLLSDAAVKKEGYIQKELRFALSVALEKPEETIFIIPLRLDDCFIPRSLKTIQYIDYYPSERQDFAFKKVVESLKIRANALGLSFSVQPSSNNLIAKPTNKFTPDGNRIFTFGDIDFVRVPAGKFVMGSDIKGAVSGSKKPKYGMVELDIPYDYFIGRFQVRNLDYAKYYFDKYERNYQPGAPFPEHLRSEMSINPDDNAPVVVMMIWDILAYIKWLNERFSSDLPNGYEFQLPTEVEWEKAARGVDGRHFPWGNTVDSTKCNSLEGGIGTTTPVGKYSPAGDSPYGASDMAGNVWEFTSSLIANIPSQIKRFTNEEIINSRKHIVIRGGSFRDKTILSISSFRNSTTRNSLSSAIGFRLCLAPHSLK